jgi:hypothetical protein
MTPTEYMIEAMTDIDDVETVVIIRRLKGGGIMYNSNTGSNFDIYAMVNITKAYVEAELTKREIAD